jgi:hypothetical protein
MRSTAVTTAGHRAARAMVKVEVLMVEEYDDAMICSNDDIRRWAANINCGRDVAFSDEGVVGYSIQKSSERSDPTAQRVERGTRVFDNRQKDG